MAVTTGTTNILKGTMTRPEWGGANATIDQHLELYEGTVDSQFIYDNIFKSLSTQKSVEGRSNQISLRRLGNSDVKARKAGDDVISQRVLSDKLNIVVDVMMYIRNHIDYIDDWTAPDYWTEMGRNNGTQFALEYDQAHIIRLQKARTWSAPAHLQNGVFYGGLSVQATLDADAATEAELEANADALVNAHAAIVNEMIKRRVPLNSLVTIVDTQAYSDLTHSKKLLDRDFSEGNGDFAGRRVTKLNGIPVVESTAFPTEATGVGEHHMLSTDANSNAFDVTADDVKGTMIVFSKTHSLVTVNAREWETDLWDDKEHKSFVLDHQAMFTVDVRRPDTVGVVLVTRA